jgi:N-acetylmuramic acid 6-phosphate etherase
MWVYRKFVTTFKAKDSLSKTLQTEKRNRASRGLDSMSALQIAATMNREDATVPRAIKKVLPQIAEGIDLIARQLARGGRLIYLGTGTSGRIGALDAAEVPPTFGLHPDTVQFVIAGGEQALARAAEANEDDPKLGRRDMAKRKPSKKDVVVGLAASGRTPYTIAALQLAQKKGAATIAVVCNRRSELARHAQLAIEVEVGPEVLTGSTRLKAGTAQKLICNMLSTGAMARLGYVYDNLMVNLRPKNTKLFERAISIIENVAGVDRAAALRTLDWAGGNVPLAILMLRANLDRAKAERRLHRAGGIVRKALAD